MNESIAKAFATQSFTGYWKILHKSYPEEYFGEFLYDPIKGRHILTLYGICIFPIDNAPKITAITGSSSLGKKVSVFDLVITNASTGTGEIISKKTVFSFVSFCVGDKCFFEQDSIRLRKYSFRCTNLESWSNCQPFVFHLSRRKKRVLGKINVPDPLMIYEDDIVKIKLETIINQTTTLHSLSASYHLKVVIEAKGNRKLPYFAGVGSFSYYENIVYSLFGLMIGKHTISFNRIGILEKKRITLPPNVPVTLLKKRFYSSPKVEFFYARKVEERWLDEIDRDNVLLRQGALNKEEFLQVARCFFAQFPKFGFALCDWMVMRNATSYTNHSLPELLYNFEGVHRALYPNCDTKSGYKNTIDAIHNISPFNKYDDLINNKNHKLPFRQRLQDILLIRAAPLYSFLTVPQKNDIISYLVDVRNNAAHQGGEQDWHFHRSVSCILLCEELIAVMIFLNLGLPISRLQNALRQRMEWTAIKDMICNEFAKREETSPVASQNVDR